MGIWDEHNKTIDGYVEEAFKGEKIWNLSTYEKRKIAYDYLYNRYSFDYKELEEGGKDTKKQIRKVLKTNKGICNPIIYVYKMMLEKVGVYGMVLFCMDVMDPHTILLVNNGSGNLSFDDLSLAIYGKNKINLGISKEDRFDYDLEDARKMDQGINEVRPGEYYDVSESSIINGFFDKNDKIYLAIKPPFVIETLGFSYIKNYIRSCKKDNTENGKIR